MAKRQQVASREWRQFFVNLTPNEFEALHAALCWYADKYPEKESFILGLAKKLGIQETQDYINQIAESRKQQQMKVDFA